MRRLTNSVYIRFPQTQKYQDEKTAVQPQCIRGHSSLDLVRDNEPGILVFYNKGRGSDQQCANNKHDRNSYSCNIFHDNSRRKPRIRSMVVALQSSSHSARSAADSSINCFHLHSFLLFLSVFHGPGGPADYTEARHHQRCQYQSNCCGKHFIAAKQLSTVSTTLLSRAMATNHSQSIMGDEYNQHDATQRDATHYTMHCKTMP
mmetsp:Transcript_25391/g.69968  ORF Transcript_25391/g.69968 Transcript_25391/m.69968 type:complete len:204 (+) Transcript_25391:1060-1671(+)